MSEVIRQLHQDHANLARLLGILESELDNVHAWKPADFETMRDLMHYMAHYPDKFHHPREDLIFQRVVQLDPGTAETIDHLVEEHRILAEKGGRLLQSLSFVVDGELVRRDELEAAGRDYVATLRAHIGREEGAVLPLAEKLLSTEDWSAIDAAADRQDDPLFGKILADDYKNLYAYITDQAD